MKALTVLEPWATLIVEGKKIIETRNWDTDYRGKILIHSSKTIMRNEDYVQHLLQFVDKNHLNFNRGCIIGEVDLVDIKPVSLEFLNLVKNTNYIDYITSEWTTCKYVWILDNPKFYDKPIPAKGSLGLWEYKKET